MLTVSPQNLFHWFRTFNKVVFTFSGILIGILLVFLLFFLIYCLFKLKSPLQVLAFLFMRGGSDEESELSFSFFGTFFTLVFFILNTELVIRWNHISGVHNVTGTGQVIPLVVAAAGLVRVIWKFLVLILKLTQPEGAF